MQVSLDTIGTKPNFLFFSYFNTVLSKKKKKEKITILFFILRFFVCFILSKLIVPGRYYFTVRVKLQFQGWGKYIIQYPQ